MKQECENHGRLGKIVISQGYYCYFEVTHSKKTVCQKDIFTKAIYKYCLLTDYITFHIYCSQIADNSLSNAWVFALIHKMRHR